MTANVEPQQSDDNDQNIKFIPIGWAQTDAGSQIDQWKAVTQNSPLPVYLPSISTLPAGTNRIGVVTIGGGTVTIGAGTAQIGSVTVGNSVTVGAIIGPSGGNCLRGISGSGDAVRSLLFVKDNAGSYGETSGSGTGVFNIPVYGSVTIGSGTSQIGSVTVGNSVTIGALPVLLSTTTIGGTSRLNVTLSSATTIGGTAPSYGNLHGGSDGTNLVAISVDSSGRTVVTGSVSLASLPALAAGTAQIGSVTASLAISSTAITSGSFTSLTSATLVPANTARKMATVYNLGAGQLFVQAGASATTLGGGFMVALSSGDFYECDYTTTTLSAIFATAGTASWVSH